MPKFRVNYSYQQGPDHHSPDYMNPDAPLDTYHDSRTVEAANKEDAERKFKTDKPYATITSIEEIKE
jgi:hypothetical protein